MLFIGPPGSGKTMLAQRIPSVMPALGFSEALEVTKIYSVAGRLDKGQALIVTRPFRSPHHTISDAGLIGGGQIPRPGEVSLAHRGVLFLDELPEFKKHVLEVLRQPLEDGKVTISRAAMSLDYPADFMLVAAMNPCPCGYLGDDRHPCRCSPLQVSSYRSRLSGPLLDRIDLHVEVPAVPYKDLKEVKSPVDSAAMRGRIEAARAIQIERYAGAGLLENSQLSGERLSGCCGLEPGEHAFLEKAVHALGLSARAYTRVLRIARTIADLEAAPLVRTPHLAEAIQYRTLDREQS
jgi:magnesium chelatase family protein